MQPLRNINILLKDTAVISTMAWVLCRYSQTQKEIDIKNDFINHAKYRKLLPHDFNFVTNDLQCERKLKKMIRNWNNKVIGDAFSQLNVHLDFLFC